MNNFYIVNKTTGKLELHFDKDTYLLLSDAEKSKIKSNFLFSRASGAWISRCKWPNLFTPESVAKSLNLQNAGTTGERLTFEEQKAAEAERAERRAEYYDAKSEAAIVDGKRLQAPIDRMRGDIAFFTQPNINSSAGRAFTNRRNKMFDAWERGFEYFKKSEYYEEKSEAARRTAGAASGNVDKAFCERRIADAEKTIKAQKRNIENYYKKDLERLQAGEVIKRYNGELLTVETVEGWINNAEEIIEANIEKAIYYRELIAAQGGVNYSKENIKKGYIVKLHKWSGAVEVVSTGPKNFTYKTGSGFCLQASYAEIDAIIKDVEKIEAHPFKAGEVYTVKKWTAGGYIDYICTIVKTTDKSVTIEGADGVKVNRRPAKSAHSGAWIVSMFENYNGSFYKTEAAIC